MPAWASTPHLLGLDTETTSRDATTAHPVVCAITRHSPTGQSTPTGFPLLINPEIPISAEATSVHGITTDYARTHGAPLAEALETINTHLLGACREGYLLVAANARYDLTVLDHASRRAGVTPLTERANTTINVFDPMLVDRWWDRYRKGPRNLAALCDHYQVPHNGPHQAHADAEAAVALARALLSLIFDPDAELGTLASGRWEGDRWAELRACVTPAQVHALQRRWSRDRAADYQSYRRRTDDASFVEPEEWPILPFARQHQNA